MRQFVSTVLASFFLLHSPGCGIGPDNDGDDAEEPGPGPDRDDDGLSDADEKALGTDPDVPDSDGDGYLDGDEVTEGSDPLDPDSWIYVGGWPYNRNKDAIDDPGRWICYSRRRRNNNIRRTESCTRKRRSHIC